MSVSFFPYTQRYIILCHLSSDLAAIYTLFFMIEALILEVKLKCHLQQEGMRGFLVQG